jgi:subtilisin family serine protease
MKNKSEITKAKAKPTLYSRALIIFILTISLAITNIPVSSQNNLDGFDPSNVTLIPPELVSKDYILPNMSTKLSMLNSASLPNQILNKTLAEELVLETDGERVMVTLIMLDQESADRAIGSLPELGAEVIVTYSTWIDAWVPVEAMKRVAALPGVSLMREPAQVLPAERPPAPQLENAYKLKPNLFEPTSPMYITQGVNASGAHKWHAAGWKGAGVKVAVIDSFQYYKQAQAGGELPANIKLFNQLHEGNPHGTAVAEIIYDMAPGVQFTFASGGTPTYLAWLIEELAKQGHHIISSSVGYQGLEAGDGTGPMNDAIMKAYYNYRTLYVQAAGNEAKHHWDGRFKDTNNDGWHEFKNGSWINWLSHNGSYNLPAGREIKINLRWSSWPTTSNDYDLYLVHYLPGQPVKFPAESIIRQNGSTPPTEFINFKLKEEGTYGIAIHKVRATGNEDLDLYGHHSPDYWDNVPDRSLIDAAVSPYALAVAALDANSKIIENYSSRGPTKGPGGWILGGQRKPNISAYANVDTWSYGIRGFNGTSAAQPHVAGAAALVMEAYPNLHPYYIWAHLLYMALDRGFPGPDFIYGRGELRMMDPPPTKVQYGYTPPGQCVDCDVPNITFKIYAPLIRR